MFGKTRIPIRLKILVSLLLVLTVVVSLITFTMARMFHEDKRVYIHDLSSVVALSAADETRTLLVGYTERLRVFARLMTAPGVAEDARQGLLRELFTDFPDLLALSLYEDGKETRVAYDSVDLEAAGLEETEIARFRESHPIPLEEVEKGLVFIQNTTVGPDLPAFTLAVSRTADGEDSAVSAAIFHTDSLQRIVRRSKLMDIYLADSSGVYLAASDPGLVARRAVAAPLLEAREELGGVSASLARQYDLDGTPMVGGFATVDVGNVMAVAQIPVSAAYLASRELLRSLLGVTLTVLILATLASLLWARTLTRPLEKLLGATREIARGRFEIEVASVSGDEIGALASSFNQMAVELHGREQALQMAQAQLVQSEKMAAFGQLGAGIAHEVKNPLAGILGCAQLSLRKIDRESPIGKNLELIEKETRRCKTIIENLLKFARQEKAVFSTVGVNGIVEDAVAIVNHQLELNHVKVEKELEDELPLIQGNANQLQQVVMNLMINAQQAMEGTPGTVSVGTRRAAPDRVEIVVRDTGPGMPAEVRTKVFEPFFTTKPGGKGTGLGLSVSYGIVKDHRGEISVASEPGQGATFTISLPTASSEAGGSEEASQQTPPASTMESREPVHT